MNNTTIFAYIGYYIPVEIVEAAGIEMDFDEGDTLNVTITKESDKPFKEPFELFAADFMEDIKCITHETFCEEYFSTMNEHYTQYKFKIGGLTYYFSNIDSESTFTMTVEQAMALIEPFPPAEPTSRTKPPELILTSITKQFPTVIGDLSVFSELKQQLEREIEEENNKIMNKKQ